jgi:hypothetical protein
VVEALLPLLVGELHPRLRFLLFLRKAISTSWRLVRREGLLHTAPKNT